MLVQADRYGEWRLRSKHTATWLAPVRCQHLFAETATAVIHPYLTIASNANTYGSVSNISCCPVVKVAYI